MTLSDIDITKSIRIIDWLKSELLTSIAELFATLIKGINDTTKDNIASIISNIIVIAYLLAKRLGIEFEHIDIKAKEKLKLGIKENHDIEKNYGELSELLKKF